jgi:hypothetical protein
MRVSHLEQEKRSRTEMSAVEESIRAILTVSIASTLKEAGFDAVVSFALPPVSSALRCLLNEPKVAVVQFEKGKNVVLDVQLVSRSPSFLAGCLVPFAEVEDTLTHIICCQFHFLCLDDARDPLNVWWHGMKDGCNR